MNAQVYSYYDADQIHEHILKSAVKKSVLKLNISKNIVHISKPHTCEFDIYECEVSHLHNKRLHIMTETWIRGDKSQESNYVKHVKILKEWKETQDHSKWAIQKKPKYNLFPFNMFCVYRVFIGDLNTMDSQKKRGGGGIMIDGNKQLWNCFHNLIE
jgi:hypothetical protein